MEPIAVIFLIGFFKVAARAFQQKNVMLDRWFSIIPTSYVMGALEVAMVGVSAIEIIEEGWSQALWIALSYSTGGWIGCWFAIWLHKKVHK
jgi:hypothetical protein